MPISSCYLFKNSLEFLPVSEINRVPAKVRGIYVLYHARKNCKQWMWCTSAWPVARNPAPKAV